MIDNRIVETRVKLAGNWPENLTRVWFKGLCITPLMFFGA